MVQNINARVIEDFGLEWKKFDQSRLPKADQRKIFDAYFSIFPWSRVSQNSVGFDLGCGSGRWAETVSLRTGGVLHCIDASPIAIEIAKKNLSERRNCQFHVATINEIPLDNESADFGYSIGVLHHLSDTARGIRCCVQKLKRGAPLLLYLYYAFENKPVWYRWVWKLSELGRFFISRMPFLMKYFFSQLIALFVYFPLARLSYGLERLGANVDSIPLAYYRNKSFYVIRTDALDRFGTKIERRFTKDQILRMMKESGLENISFGNLPPYWTVLGYKV